MKTEKQNLKPCPHCGGDADIEIIYAKYSTLVKVKCCVCGSETKAYKVNSENPEQCRGARKAICSWNLRVNGEGVN